MFCDYCSKNFEPNRKGSGGTNRKFCFDCMPEGLSKQERKNLRHHLYSQRMRNHKINIGCQECGYDKIGAALEWHHPDPNKEMNASDAVKLSWETYLNEAEKCILLCCRCHMEKHFS
jgi:hypothetical protein